MKNNIIILNSKDKKQIRKILEKEYNVKEIPNKIYFCISSKDNVYITNKELFDPDHFLLRVSSFGMLFGTFINEEFYLSIEGSQMISKQISKNVYELNEEEKKLWIKGFNLENIADEYNNKILILKYNNDFFGSAKVKKGIIKNNFLKSRIIKNTF